MFITLTDRSIYLLHWLTKVCITLTDRIYVYSINWQKYVFMSTDSSMYLAYYINDISLYLLHELAELCVYYINW